LPSVARLTEVLRRPFTRHVDKIEIGRQDSDRWLSATELMIGAASAEPFREPILHIHYLNLVNDPLGTVTTLYRHFGRTLDPGAATRVSRLVQEKPNGGYGTRRAQLEEYGLDSDSERQRYATYIERFGIRPEQRKRPRRGAKNPSLLASRRSVEAVE
jgi:hypothetical protein